MNIQSVYRGMPAYLTVPLALVVSAIAALALAVLGAVAVDSLLDEFRGSADLGHSFLAFFYAGPAIAVLGFVACFSILIKWHHATSWRTPTLAFALGATSLWVWAHSFGGIGFGWYLPGMIAWLLSCWLLHRKSSSSFHHVLQA
jgi:hypothetical protein